jgi:Co/Zn/Cd efflux system component
MASVKLLVDGDTDGSFGHAMKPAAIVADSASKRARRQLVLATSCCVLFMAAEVVGGYFAHSLAIMTE